YSVAHELKDFERRLPLGLLQGQGKRVGRDAFGAEADPGKSSTGPEIMSSGEFGRPGHRNQLGAPGYSRDVRRLGSHLRPQGTYRRFGRRSSIFGSGLRP